MLCPALVNVRASSVETDAGKAPHGLTPPGHEFYHRIHLNMHGPFQYGTSQGMHETQAVLRQRHHAPAVGCEETRLFVHVPQLLLREKELLHPRVAGCFLSFRSHPGPGHAGRRVLRQPLEHGLGIKTIG